MVYKWSERFSYDISADVVGKEFEKLEKKNGKVTRENVLEAARKESSPIHKIFEWDDTKAAERFRLHQASQLICALCVEVETSEETPVKIRAFVDVGVGSTGKFMNVDSAFKNNETREIVMERALRELKAFEKKYRALSEFSTLFDVINELTA